MIYRNGSVFVGMIVHHHDDDEMVNYGDGSEYVILIC